MIDWTNIPSLAALRAFEAAARLGSLTAAAKSLNVTHAAIAHHIRGLEADLGRTLVTRQGRGIAITADGQDLAKALEDGFETIAAGIAALRDDDESRPLNLSVTPAFATSWLMPRIGDFWSRHPDIQLNIAPSVDLTDLRRDGIDIAIRYGKGPWPPYDTRILTDGAFWVVAHPKLLNGRRADCVPDVVDLPWLMEKYMLERRALVEAQGASLSDMHMTLMTTNALVLAAAKEGLGVTIQPKSLVERDVTSGALHRICTLDGEGLGYHIVTDPARRSPRIDAVLRWLRSQR